jgi:transposase
VGFRPGGPGGAEGVYTDMEQWTRIRLALREGRTSKRELMRQEGIHWETLRKIQDHPEPPGYRMDFPRPKPKLGPYLEVIAQIIKDDKLVPKKQRHTATRIYHCLKEMGYRGKYTQVKEAVREIKRVSREVYMPLVHRPGEAQVDFGYALAKVSGVLRKVALFIMALPYSDAFFVAAFEKECGESYWEGHVRAFEFFGGVPQRISYDNSKVLVSKIIGSHERELTDGFLKLQSHYLFQEHFCRVRRPNEKGVVEGVVKYVRQNFMVPVPGVKDLAEFNALLAQKCRDDLNRRLRGKGGSKWELLQEDQAAFAPLPPSRFDACRKQPTRANSLSLVRFDDNDYSVVARHSRSWEKEGVFFDYRHYLPLLERKPGALDHARPLAGLDLPECFEVLRRRLVAGEEKQGYGTRKYIKVLRLLEDHSMARLKQAVEKGLFAGAYGPEAIAWFLAPRSPWPPSTFILDGREHLSRVSVAGPDIAAYDSLLSQGGAP